MILIVARHCQTKLNEENRIQGRNSNFGLNSYGELQATALKTIMENLLPNQNIDTIYVSNSIRTIQTAEILTQLNNENFIIDDRLMSFDVGTAENKKFDEIKHIKRFPNPIYYSNMESILGFLKRTKNVLKDILLNNENKIVLVVTHEDVSAMFEKYLMNKSYLSVPNLGLETGTARIYNIFNYDKNSISKGDFSKLKIFKKEIDANNIVSIKQKEMAEK